MIPCSYLSFANAVTLLIMLTFCVQDVLVDDLKILNVHTKKYEKVNSSNHEHVVCKWHPRKVKFSNF